MRTGLSTIQQTLTPEAVSVLNASIAEAGRRNHGQTTPLHVAATLLASPTGFLRQACLRSHPATSHPLQCRALDLCFSVALDRLPSSTSNNNPAGSGSSSSGNGGGVEQPGISNALMAALKRAQAHQRRGCPEQQQQPLLAVKVELEQLVVSILDDPGVSRVMREAHFSSPAVKSTIEQSLLTSSSNNNTTSPSTSNNNSSSILSGLGFRPPAAMPLLPVNRNLYLNPRLQQQQQGSSVTGVKGFGGQQQRGEEVEKVVNILRRSKKRNPVLVGESETEALVKEVLQRVERGDGGALRNIQVISLGEQFASDRSQIPVKLKELGNSIENRLNSGDDGVIVDLGDLKWLVESTGGGAGLMQQQQQQIVSETGRVVVAEMGKLLARFAEGGGGVWLIGTATCATYLRCQVYHPTMENDWDLQAVPIAPRAPIPGMFPRIEANGILSSSVGSLAPQKILLRPPSSIGATTTLALKRPSEKAVTTDQALCPACNESYGRELAKLVAKEVEKSSSDSKPDPSRSSLPPWIQAAKLSNTKEKELMWKQTTEELQKKWTETCSRLHPDHHRPAASSAGPLPPPALSVPNSYNSTVLRPNAQPKLQLPRDLNRKINTGENPAPSPPGSPVRTDLILGRPKAAHKEGTERIGVGDFAAATGNLDMESFKSLFKGLSEKVSWQPEAAAAVATAVMQCKSGNGRRRRRAAAAGVRGETWLLFLGPDRVGKRKMAAALSDLVVGASPITVHLAGDGESNPSFRGKTALDRVVETVRRNPFSVIVLEDVDRADLLLRGSLRRALEQGRLPDSHGREVSLGSVTFVMTSETLPDNLTASPEDSLLRSEEEEKLFTAASSGWQLEISKAGKRRSEWWGERMAKKKPNGGLSLDLNLAAGIAAGGGGEEDAGEGSGNSSDLTVEHESNDYGRLAVVNRWPSSSSVATELIDSVDEAVVFKPVDFGPLRKKVSDTIAGKFDSVVGGVGSLRIDGEVLDRMVGGIWFGASAASAAGLEEWAERVLVPRLQQLKRNSTEAIAGDGGVSSFKLQLAKEGCVKRSGAGGGGEWLPSRVRITGDGI